MSKRWKTVVGLGLTLLLVAGVAWASEHGGGGHGDKIMNLVYRTINFILVVGIIYKLVGKRIGDFFSGRTRQIEAELKDLEERRAQAESRLKEVEAKIANLEKEREEILQAAKEQGEAVKAQIIEKAKKSAEQIKEQAKITAEQEAKAVFDQVKAELADKIVEAAEKMIQERLSGDIHKKLINEYLTKVVIN
ncbi:F0F1 ATP synthase subunit B family protein [Desulfonauticus submarinus]